MKKHRDHMPLSDLFDLAMRESDYSSRKDKFMTLALDSPPSVVWELASYYFGIKHVEREAELAEKPYCDECGEYVMTDAHAFEDYNLCSEQCRVEKIKWREKCEKQAQIDAKLLPLSPLKSCHHCGSAYKSLYKTRCCSSECDRDLIEDFEKNGHICVQCETRTPGRSRRHYYCEPCETDRRKDEETKRDDLQKQKDKEYAEGMERWGLFRDQQIRNRELRSVKQLSTEHRARLRHYKDLTEAIDKGELVSVARK